MQDRPAKHLILITNSRVLFISKRYAVLNQVYDSKSLQPRLLDLPCLVPYYLQHVSSRLPVSINRLESLYLTQRTGSTPLAVLAPTLVSPNSSCFQAFLPGFLSYPCVECFVVMRCARHH
jgi:hypothetical protein